MIEIYEFLESKGMNNEEINMVYEWYDKQKEDFDFLARLIAVYDVFTFAGLYSDQINKLLVNNLEILSMNSNEIFKLACVLKYSPYTDMIFDLEDRRILMNASNYKRIFMRSILFMNRESENRNSEYSSASFTNRKSEPSATALLCNNREAYGPKFNINKYVFPKFKANAGSDEELESLFNASMIVDNVPKTVDELINDATSKFRKDYLFSKNKARTR